ncbi:hypothetical protein AFB00_16740 [Pseudonocardia sp. HH130630-07]|nr:hypothetical protein AFB00_16740 [Pseudonocardia sp. HH130630-07]
MLSALVLAAGIAFTGTAAAQTQGGTTYTSNADGVSDLGPFSWDVTKRPDGTVVGGASIETAFVKTTGRVTCAEFDGNRVGFLFTLGSDTKPAVLAGLSMFITAEDRAFNTGDIVDPDKADLVGGSGAAPAAAFIGCKPSLTPFRVQSGDIANQTRNDDDEG